jgi:hypothetical protein
MLKKMIKRLNVTKWVYFAFFAIIFTACTTSPDIGKGKRFTFNDERVGSKLIYLCQDKPELGTVEVRAKKAHEYFTNKSNENTEKFLNDMMKHKLKKPSMVEFQKKSEELAVELNKKFSCVLVDSIDY